MRLNFGDRANPKEASSTRARVIRSLRARLDTTRVWLFVEIRYFEKHQFVLVFLWFSASIILLGVYQPRLSIVSVESEKMDSLLGWQETKALPGFPRSTEGPIEQHGLSMR